MPDTITLLHLPASSPELNPIELVWPYLRQNKLANRVFRPDQDIVDAGCDAWTVLADSPDLVTSITARESAPVNLSRRWHTARG
ncbi:transposase [Methylobacterium aquaticum]|uniref:transposase n=1 Tax=Methylobacterium aquaticum TaxID=270351 RepID=UPI0018CCD3B9